MAISSAPCSACLGHSAASPAKNAPKVAYLALAEVSQKSQASQEELTELKEQLAAKDRDLMAAWSRKMYS